jgi:glycosyltransferase involved in cell wall biosynthesis
MRFLLVTGHSYLPQRTGGSEVSMHELCLLLQNQGHEVFVVSALKNENSLLFFLNRIKSRFAVKGYGCDLKCGYPVFRDWDHLANIDSIVQDIKPDAAIVFVGQQIVTVQKLVDLNVPTICYFRDVAFKEWGGAPFLHEKLSYISNSNFTRQKIFDHFAVDSVVINPVVFSNIYRCDNFGKNILQIGLFKEKGIEISFSLAELFPHLNFVFLESWPVAVDVFSALEKRAHELGNVKLFRFTDNMSEIYKNTSILLVPSMCEEAWGRVVTESQFFGIPSIASNIGGLPESVGNSGILVDDYCKIDGWKNALTQMDDKDTYLKYSKNAYDMALSHSDRSGFLVESIINIAASLVEVKK